MSVHGDSIGRCSRKRGRMVLVRAQVRGNSPSTGAPLRVPASSAVAAGR
jgi:hypothetical protein